MELFFALLFGWPGFFLLCFFGVIFDANDGEGFAAFLMLLAGGIYWVHHRTPLGVAAMDVALYLFVGVIWSFYRYMRFVKERVLYFKEAQRQYGWTDEHLLKETKSLSVTNVKGKVAAWILDWPLGVVGYFTRDAILLIQSLISTVFKGTYDKIHSWVVRRYLN